MSRNPGDVTVEADGEVVKLTIEGSGCSSDDDPWDHDTTLTIDQAKTLLGRLNWEIKKAEVRAANKDKR